ncbi:glutaredoxin domain-containing protein [Mangrovihabitans endophyticus]|uniref:Membrane protein n=1 Tax=Mangrovihabitans endophyticus TaxID=1751298 RepID=A0A8J3C0E9_9ACTN|nr:glutaredoxin domain-containing protein [Mangrovihabitans endophyticus]GGL00777.1 membrane protein [Mangrovihabitans endophyticus]
MTRRWGIAAAMLVAAVLFAVLAATGDTPAVNVVLAVFFGVLALLFSPRAFPRSVTDAEARSGDRPIVYWRPGCPYCLRLRTVLGRDAKRLTWVDIWADPAGAASVRAVADGNETVPTVIAHGEAMVNPDPARIKTLASARR